jgi:p-hydroxybenzoate 3-monooxygenase
VFNQRTYVRKANEWSEAEMGDSTQVVVIGGGPAGLLLCHLLDALGVDTVLLEARSPDYVLGRIRAGVLESSSVDVLTEAGLGERLHREGLEHRGIHLQWPGERHHIDFVDLTGRAVWIYGQTEVTHDLMAAREVAGQESYYEVSEVSIAGIDTDQPSVSFVDADGGQRTIRAQAVAGCDGFHGVSRTYLPSSRHRSWERTYPYAWLGVLAHVPPSTHDLIYAWHPDGFALHSLRSLEVSRFYLQVSPDEKISEWSDDRIWEGLSTRLGAGIEDWTLTPGPITEKSVLPMRSFVAAPMRHGRLFLAGDAAHIVPPTGAKGLNLAIADVTMLAPALADLVSGHESAAAAYSEIALRRVWRCTHFSWWMTSMLHTSGDPFDAELQLSQLRWVTSSTAGATGLAENYAGLPISLPEHSPGGTR